MRTRTLVTLAAAAASSLDARLATAQNAPARGGSPVARATALCRQGDEEQHGDHLTEARAHLEEGLRLLGNLQTPPARRARLACANTLAWVLEAQGDRRGAWDRVYEYWDAARTLPASAWAGYEPSTFQLAQRIWAGAQCAQGLDDANVEEAEVTVLRALARFDSAPVRECLGAIRARLAQSGRGTCRRVATLPAETPAFAPGAQGWTAVDPQTGVYNRTESVIVARVAGGATRYTECQTGMSEADVTPTAAWVLPGSALAVNLRIRPCGEDMDFRRCPTERMSFVLDGEGRLLGSYVFQRAAGVSRGPLATPFGTITAANPFTADGNAIRVGTRRLAVVQNALVAAPQ